MSMTLIERVRHSMEWDEEKRDYRNDMESDNLDRLISFAYYMGREEATRQISDQYNALIQQMRARANACRYPHMANRIIGDRDFIYSNDYGQAFMSTFGRDKTDL